MKKPTDYSEAIRALSQAGELLAQKTNEEFSNNRIERASGLLLAVNTVRQTLEAMATWHQADNGGQSFEFWWCQSPVKQDVNSECDVEDVEDEDEDAEDSMEVVGAWPRLD